MCFTDYFNSVKYKRLSKKSTYKATEVLIRDIKRIRGVKSYKFGGFEYLYNEHHKTAVLLKYIAKWSRKFFKTKLNKRPKNKNDEANRIITTLYGKDGIMHFLNNSTFEKYTLSVSVGSMIHESCMFFRNDKSIINAIYFNPSYSTVHDGPQYSKYAHQLCTFFKKKLNNIRAYYSPSGNVEAECSKLTWKEIFNHLCNGDNPFTNDNIELQEYTYCFTRKTYNKYYTKKLLYHSNWEKYEQMLKKCDISDSDFIKLNNSISKAMAEYFLTKAK